MSSRARPRRVDGCDRVGHDVPRQDVVAVDPDLLGEVADEVAGLVADAPERLHVRLLVERERVVLGAVEVDGELRDAQQRVAAPWKVRDSTPSAPRTATRPARPRSRSSHELRRGRRRARRRAAASRRARGRGCGLTRRLGLSVWAPTTRKPAAGPAPAAVGAGRVPGDQRAAAHEVAPARLGGPRRGLDDLGEALRGEPRRGLLARVERGGAGVDVVDEALGFGVGVERVRHGSRPYLRGAPASSGRGSPGPRPGRRHALPVRSRPMRRALQGRRAAARGRAAGRAGRSCSTMARTAEDVGLDSIWLGDHLLYDLPGGRHPWAVGGVDSLAALAAVTDARRARPVRRLDGLPRPGDAGQDGRDRRRDLGWPAAPRARRGLERAGVHRVRLPLRPPHLAVRGGLHDHPDAAARRPDRLPRRATTTSPTASWTRDRPAPAARRSCSARPVRG